MICRDFSYFPGCSLATTARENNASMISFLERFGIRLHELDDWNCCGSSSAHSINSDLALKLAARNLMIASSGRPLLIACPGCYLRLSHARNVLSDAPGRRRELEKRFGLRFNRNLKLIHFFEVMADLQAHPLFSQLKNKLRGLKMVPYYGCMLNTPPSLRGQINYRGLIESSMTALGGELLPWPYHSHCCGTFLSVTRPGVSQKLVRTILKGAIDAGSECIVTACAMCHLNLEIRAETGHRLPVFHFSELLSLAMDTKDRERDHSIWFKSHLIDPRPLLKERGLMA